MPKKVFVLSLISLSLFFQFSCGSSSSAVKENKERFQSLKIIHWNDFHAQNISRSIKKDGKKYNIGGSAVMKGYIDSLKNLSKNAIVLFAGDDFQGTPISSFTKGKSQLILMNELQPDVAVPGNHEFDYGKENYMSLLGEAKFDVVCANLIKTYTETTLFPPYKIIQRGGLKIAVIGLITVDLPKVSIPENIEGLEARDYEVVLSKLIPEVKKTHSPDVIIVLSHIGLSRTLENAIDDFALSRIFPEVNVFVGGHTHTPVFEPIRKGNGIIVQAGSRGQYIGELDVVVDTEKDSIVSFNGKLIETFADSVSPNLRVQELVDSLETPISKLLSEPIGTLQKDWKSKFGESSNIGTWQTDVMREELMVDIAIQNSGGIRKSLDAGDIKIRDIYEINPFGNSLVKFLIKGKEVKSMIEWQIDARGEFCDMSGIVCKYNGNFPYLRRIKEVIVAGNPIEDDRVYSIATNNYVFSQLKQMLGITSDPEMIGTPYVDNEFFIDVIRKKKVITGEGREWLINLAKKK